MKPVLYAIIAIFLYASQGVIIERKLSSISPFAIMVFFYAGVLSIVLPVVIFRQRLGLDLTMPQWNQCWIIAGCGILLFFADFCYFSSYHAGGSVTTVTIIAAILPVFASMIKFAVGGGFPSYRQLLGWVCALAAVVLVSERSPG